MSNALAIAATTEALRQLLQGELKAVNGAQVTTAHPSSAASASSEPRLNIYLYQVAPNAAFRNSALPSRSPDGALTRRPRAALDLYYLISCYGAEEAEHEPQRLLGCAIAALEARPTLTRDMIAHTVAETNLVELKASDLAAQVEAIRFVPLALNLEELSKLWSVFFQTKYALSVAYQASVVMIDANLSPQPVLPVRQAGSYAAPFQHPAITRIRALRAGDGEPRPPNEPIVAGDTLLVEGEQLLGDGVPIERVRVEVGGVELPVESGDARALRARLDDYRLRPGIQGLQIVHLMLLGEPPEPHRVIESGGVPLVLRPMVVPGRAANLTAHDGGYDGELLVGCVPSVGRRQRASLLLNEVAPPAHRPAYAYHADAAPRPPIDTPEAAAAAARARAARFTSEPERGAASQVAAAAAAAASGGDGTLGQVRAAMAAAMAQAVAAAPAGVSRQVAAAAAAVADSVDGTDVLAFALRRLRAGEYFVRVLVDGAESPLTVDSQQFTGPRVTIP